MTPALAAAPAFAEPATIPATQGAALDVLVLEVKGTAQASTDDGKTWTPAKAGLHLSRGAEFRTGFHSSVTCGIAPDQGFTLESLSTVRVEEAIKRGTHFKTDLVMKYGATNYSIETGNEGGVEHDTTIGTPASVLSVRGTVVRVTDRPGFAPTAESFTGRAVYKTAKGTTTVGKKGGSYSRVSADEGDPAKTALSQTVVDPAGLLARTATDAQLIAQQASLGALVSFDTRANITVVRGAPPLPDGSLPQSLPGVLDFVLRWTGNADLNLEVYSDQITAKDIAAGKSEVSLLNPAPTQPLTPSELGQIGSTFQGATELLYPGYGFNVSPSRGVIPYDNRGGPTGGMELAYWLTTPPATISGIKVLHVSGGVANYQVNAYENGKPLNLYFPGSFTDGFPNDVKGPIDTGTLTNKNNASYGDLIYVPANAYFDTNPKIPLLDKPSLLGGTPPATSASSIAAARSKTVPSTPKPGDATKSAPPSFPTPGSSPPTARVRDH